MGECAIALLIGRPRRSAMSYGGGHPMVDALVGIAATIYIFKFIVGLFRPNPAVWRCLQVDGGCGYGPEQACECSDEAKELWIRQGCKEFHLKTSG
jgi:hypothetical protein